MCQRWLSDFHFHYIYKISHIFLTQSYVDRSLGCFHSLAIVNNAFMNIGMHALLGEASFWFSEDILRTGVAGSYSNSIFSFLKNLHAVFFLIFLNFLMDLYFWLHWVFAVSGLSLVVVGGGYSLLWGMGFSLWGLLLLWSTGPRHTGFSCSMWPQ